MFWKICFIDNSETVRFAAAELKRHLERMDSHTEAALLKACAFRVDFTGALWVGLDDAFSDKLPECENHETDDGIFIDVTGTKGIITGVNERSVLIAVYRFLTELGCAWVRPGPDGEIIPAKTVGADTVRIREVPSYRHRGICIEGAVSYDHVLNIIDWLPKVGMNAYFNQFIVPFTFFDRWYTHSGNPTLGSSPLSIDEIGAIVSQHILEIKKRGLLYHATGHGWTCDPFGIEGTGWDNKDYYLPPESAEFLALVNGKREFSSGLPLNTNLCYSNPAVRDRMTSAITCYCEKNMHVDYLHFWLADGANNHCECENCSGTRPSDYYVRLLNELDAKLAAKGLDTKIVFLIYVDLLWEPQTERLNNPDRFVLMFAPITRTYTSSYAKAGLDICTELAPYIRNKLDMPRNIAENVARLKKWQAQFNGDSFIFDYHYMWDHFRDAGGMHIASVLFEDMEYLAELGLNGMVSCQVQRAFFPTGLGVNLMAKALWDRNSDFDYETDKYLATAFGKRSGNLRKYLETLSREFDLAYLCHEKPQSDDNAAKRFKTLPAIIDSFRAVIDDALSDSDESLNVKKSWEILLLHADYCVMLADALHSKASGDMDMLAHKWEKIADWARKKEIKLSDVLDLYYFLKTMSGSVIDNDIKLF